MDELGKEFLDFLATVPVREARHELYNLLGVLDNEINVYYFTPLSNLKRIVADGGIKCRAMVGSDITDLSGHEVQKRRDKSLRLARKVSTFEISDKKIHECVNFFWNPINDTSRAFQRNSLLLAADKDEDTFGIVCILEMRLSAFFECDNVYWSTSKQNLASNDFSTFLSGSYTQFDWETIFSTRDDINTNQFRSAEFIALYSNPTLTISDLIPAQFIKRILVPTQYEPMIKDILPSVQDRIYSLENPNVFYPKSKLLHAEKELIKTIGYLQKWISVEKFCELVITFSNFKEQLGCNLTDKYFISKKVAHSYHGISHITRVMFWVHILCYLTDTRWQTEKVAQYAAFIHDLCRKDNRMEEGEHGSNAANKFTDFLRQKQIPDSLLHSCMNAVNYHCKDDCESPNKDLLWKLLKDADSLDRGRFGHPQGLRGIRKKSKGCDITYLRLDFLKKYPKVKEYLAWSAYWLASITQYTKWSKNTFMDLKNELVKSLKASVKNDILDQDKRQRANKMLRHLSDD
jgi:hypothetical protein